MENNIDVKVPNTLMQIKTKFAKTIEDSSEKDRKNKMASGRELDESDSKVKTYMITHLPRGQTTKRQFKLTAPNDTEALAAANERMQHRPDSRLISVKKHSTTIYHPNLVKEQNLQELSKEVLKSYRAKADDSLKTALKTGDKETVKKRLKGLKVATKKYFS